MTDRVCDIIDIPATKPNLIVKVSEIDDATKRAYHVDEYVITPSVVDGLRGIVQAVAESADKGYPGQGCWVSGAFGTGKSHFMSYLGMLLRGEEVAWEREIPGVTDLSPSPREKLTKRPICVVPYNCQQRSDSLRLGLYASIQREIARLGLPKVDLTEFQQVIGWFEEQAGKTSGMWQRLYDESLTCVDRVAYDASKADPTKREVLAQEIAQVFGLGQVNSAESFAAPPDEALRRVTSVLRQQGYGGLVFLLDEFTLLLSTNRGIQGTSLQILNRLLEAPEAEVPVWCVVARHAPLEDVVEPEHSAALDHIKGRFQYREVSIDAVDLYEILGQRVLRTRSGKESARHKAVERTRDSLPQLGSLYALYEPKAFRLALERLYPFHPAIVDTIVSVTDLLSRERTAISVMYDMLFAVAKEAADTLVPHHRAFHFLIESMSDSELAERPTLQAAKEIINSKVVPMLRDKHLANQAEVDRDLAVAHSIVLGQLTDKGKALLSDRMTPEVLVALNAGTLDTEIPILAEQEVEEAVALLVTELMGTFRRQDEAITVDLSLGLDPLEELRKIRVPNRQQWERKAVRKVLENLFQTSPDTGRRRLRISNWRGTVRKGGVEAVTPESGTLPTGMPDDDFLVWLAFPRYVDESPVEMRLPTQVVAGAFWEPVAAAESTKRQVEDLTNLLYVRSPKGRTLLYDKYSGDEARKLEQQLQESQMQMMDRVTAALKPLYMQGSFRATCNGGATSPQGDDIEELLQDLASRLLDARYRQHPDFASKVTPQALGTLLKALVDGVGRVDASAGSAYEYSKAYGAPLRVVVAKGAGHELQLGNSLYVQRIEGLLSSESGQTVRKIDAEMAREYGMDTQVTRFLIKLLAAFRDVRVVRDGMPLDVSDDPLQNLNGSDGVLAAERLSVGTWAQMVERWRAYGLQEVTVPADQPSVAEQGRLWVTLRETCEQCKRRLQTLKQQVQALGDRYGSCPDSVAATYRLAERGVLALQSVADASSSEKGLEMLALAELPVEPVGDLLTNLQAGIDRVDREDLQDLVNRVPDTDRSGALAVVGDIADHKIGYDDGAERLVELIKEKPSVKTPSDSFSLSLSAHLVLTALGKHVPQALRDRLHTLGDRNVAVEVRVDKQV